MRVWHITKSLYGGAGIYAQRLSDALRDTGMDSGILCDEAVGNTEAQELLSISGVAPKFATRVIRSMSHRMTSRAYQSMMGMEIYQAEKMPQQGDIIHLHGLTGWIGLRALNALIPDGSPVFWTSHDLWPLSGGCIVYSGCDGYQKDCGSCPILRKGVKTWAKIELKLKEKLIRENKVRPIANSGWMASHIEGSRVFEGVKDVPIIPPIVGPSYFAPDIENMRVKLKIVLLDV